MQVCLTPWVNGEAPSAILCLTVNASFGLLAYGNGSGLVIVDFIQVILNHRMWIQMREVAKRCVTVRVFPQVEEILDLCKQLKLDLFVLNHSPFHLSCCSSNSKFLLTI